MTDPATTFRDLDLHEAVLRAVEETGYDTPTPIQAQTIPPLLAGRDVLGQAQTGTGKTAAFALPLLSVIDLSRAETQALILAPTRELALQVSEAVKTYGKHLKGLNVLPIYGGTGFDGQLRSLRRGAHVVVGTPGRVMDHLRRGTLKLDGMDTLVLDEADEMLRMGFIDDVEWILEQAPPERRIALFSATMPRVIRKIASKHLREPVEVRIEQDSAAAETVRQRFRVVPSHFKLEVLLRIIEAEPIDGMLVFTRTRDGAVRLSDALSARGHSSAALNGDVPQARREQIVDQLKDGRIDILVATDVAARGLDVDRLTHVVNFDPPHDTEAYVHRIGRTGRAGRDGDAILFVTPRERRIVDGISRGVGHRLERMILPTTEEVNARRLGDFEAKVTGAIESGRGREFRAIAEALIAQGNDPVDVATAMAAVGQGDQPLLLQSPPKWEREELAYQQRHGGSGSHQNNTRGYDGPGDDRRGTRSERGAQGGPRGNTPGLQRYRVEVGHNEGVRPGNLVGAITAETNLTGRGVGHIDIQTDHSTIELPPNMPIKVLAQLQRLRVCGKELQIKPLDGPASGGGGGNSPPKYRGRKPAFGKRGAKTTAGHKKRGRK